MYENLFPEKSYSPFSISASPELWSSSASESSLNESKEIQKLRKICFWEDTHNLFMYLTNRHFHMGEVYYILARFGTNRERSLRLKE